MHRKRPGFITNRSFYFSGKIIRSENRDTGHRASIMVFKRQFHVPVVISIFNILICIMHAQKTPETDGTVLFAVFNKMLNKTRYLYKLIQLRG